MPRVMWRPYATCSWGVGSFWDPTDLQFALGIILVAWDATTGSTICFSVCGVWLSMGIIQHTNTQLQPLPIMGMGYWWSLDFAGPLSLTLWHNCYVLVMIKHLSKWLEFVPLLYHSSKGITYTFLDKVFNRFNVPVEIFINQGTKFWGDFKDLYENTLIGH